MAQQPMVWIKLTTSDSNEPFYVSADNLVAMCRNENFTMVHYAAHAGQAAWAVKETPEEIFRQINEVGPSGFLARK